jgi:hypothetical protein
VTNRSRVIEIVLMKDKKGNLTRNIYEKIRLCSYKSTTQILLLTSFAEDTE